VKKSTFLSCALTLCATSPVAGQWYAVSPRLSIGGTSNRMVAVANLEARFEAPLRTLTPYVGVGAAWVQQSCDDSSPPQCDFPSSSAFALDFGGIFDGSVSHGIPLYASIGTGLKSWHGWDYHMTAEIGFRIRMSRAVDLDLGLRGSRLWISGRSCADYRTCPVLSGETELDTGAFVVGLRFLGGA